MARHGTHSIEFKRMLERPADRLRGLAGPLRRHRREAEFGRHPDGDLRACPARGVKARLARRPNKHHPVLPPRLAFYDKPIARRRGAAETTFATWKNRMGLTHIRYVGLAKAAAQILQVAFAFNLRRWSRLAPA